ncbi:hypothetical protein B0H14DRAFT_2633775 [Mycena olivaceomarginata]|nr:hypothetical protein B0H14DRAFT_2633775 [Mycena olivaceomarginata]
MSRLKAEPICRRVRDGPSREDQAAAPVSHQAYGAYIAPCSRPTLDVIEWRQLEIETTVNVRHPPRLGEACGGRDREQGGGGADARGRRCSGEGGERADLGRVGGEGLLTSSNPPHPHHLSPATPLLALLSSAPRTHPYLVVCASVTCASVTCLRPPSPVPLLACASSPVPPRPRRRSRPRHPPTPHQRYSAVRFVEHPELRDFDFEGRLQEQAMCPRANTDTGFVAHRQGWGRARIKYGWCNMNTNNTTNDSTGNISFHSPVHPSQQQHIQPLHPHPHALAHSHSHPHLRSFGPSPVGTGRPRSIAGVGVANGNGMYTVSLSGPGQLGPLQHPAIITALGGEYRHAGQGHSAHAHALPLRYPASAGASGTEGRRLRRRVDGGPDYRAWGPESATDASYANENGSFRSAGAESPQARGASWSSMSMCRTRRRRCCRTSYMRESRRAWEERGGGGARRGREYGLVGAVGQLSLNEDKQVRYHGKASGLHLLAHRGEPLPEEDLPRPPRNPHRPVNMRQGVDDPYPGCVCPRAACPKQDPSELQEGEKSIIDVLLDLISWPSNLPQMSATPPLLHVPLTAATLPALLARMCDADPAMHRAVYGSVFTPQPNAQPDNAAAHPQRPPRTSCRQACLDLLKEILLTERELICVVVEVVVDLREGEGEGEPEEEGATGRRDVHGQCAAEFGQALD